MIVRKLFIFFSCACFISFTLSSQTISVKSFKVFDNDLDALVNYPLLDQNGEKCAIIKVVTNQQGFVWEAGMLGIVTVEKNTGEYWVYIPHGSKRITIKHERLGILRDYVYPEAIKSATVYEMVLTTGNVTTIVEEPGIISQWCVIETVPSGANVFINNRLMGSTPFQRKLEEGIYSYRLELNMYKPSAGQFELGSERVTINEELIADYGKVIIKSSPESGINIELDGNLTGFSSPATLDKINPGEHYVRLMSKWYAPEYQQFNIEAGQVLNLNFNMTPVFGKVSVKSVKEAEIYIDGEIKGRGNIGVRLFEGVYSIEARLDNHLSDSEEITVVSGTEREYLLNPVPINGSLEVITKPTGANVIIDGIDYGTTPLTIDNLLVGKYDLLIQKERFGEVRKSILIEKDNITRLNEEIFVTKRITVSSDSPDVLVSIDGMEVGFAPVSTSLTYGHHVLYLSNRVDNVWDTITVSVNSPMVFKYNLNMGQTFTDARDGKVYRWIELGEQVWMVENLAFIQGDEVFDTEDIIIYDFTGNSTRSAKETYNYKIHGCLYSWEIAKEVCPDGWHLPTDSEWMKLEVFYGIDGKDMISIGMRRYGQVGLKLKGVMFEQGLDTGKNVITNFNAIPSGIYKDGFMDGLNVSTYYWTSTNKGYDTGYYRSITKSSDGIYRNFIAGDIKMSIRCVRSK